MPPPQNDSINVCKHNWPLSKVDICPECYPQNDKNEQDWKSLDNETIRAAKFFTSQLNKGWTNEEVSQQVIGSYGYKVYFSLIQSFRRTLK